MGFIPAKCTQCGANITVDDTQDAGVCEYCGTAFVTEKAINNYNTYITNNYDGANINIINQGAPVNPDYMCPKCNSDNIQAFRLTQRKPTYESYKNECLCAKILMLFSIISIFLGFVTVPEMIVLGFFVFLAAFQGHRSYKKKEEDSYNRCKNALVWWSNGFECKRCGNRFIIHPKENKQ